MKYSSIFYFLRKNQAGILIIMSKNNKHLRYVSYFDMLGFKSAVCRNDDEAWGALCDLQAQMQKIYSYGIKDISLEKEILNRVQCQIFSDSILMYSLGNSPEDLISILIQSAQLYYNSLSVCVPLRGAIAYGKFYFNHDLHLYCGKPFVEAAILSDDLQWSGIVVSSEVANNYFNTITGSTFFGGKLLVEWNVPSKTKPNNKNWAINWPAVFKQKIQTESEITVEEFYRPFESLFGPYGRIREYDQKKYTNTVNFVNNMLHNQ